MDNAARLQFNDDEDVERPEQQIVDNGEIAGPDVAGVIPEESRPGLTGLSASLRHVSLDRSLADFDAQLEQFAANAFRTPQTILVRHLSDKVDGFLRNTRFLLPCPRFTSPVQAKQVPVPAQEGFGLDNVQRVLPVPSDTSQQHQTNPIAVGQFRSLDLPPEDDQLLTQHRVFGDKVRTAARHVCQGAGCKRGRRRFGPASKRMF